MATFSNELKGLSSTRHSTLLLKFYACASTTATAPIDRPHSTTRS